MKSKDAVSALAALAHEGRLAIFRLLVKAGPEGLPAGAISRELNTLPNSLTPNLKILSQAGLLTSKRDGRSIIYSAEYDAMASLLGFLVEDCCAGSAAICTPLNEIVASAMCCPPGAAAAKGAPQ